MMLFRRDEGGSLVLADCEQPGSADMQPALFLLVSLPPPSSGALRLTGRDGARARGAADRRDNPGHGACCRECRVCPNERDDLVARPVKQRVHLDDAIVVIDRRECNRGAFLGLVSAQPRDPCGRSRERSSKWLDLAYRTAVVPASTES